MVMEKFGFRGHQPASHASGLPPTYDPVPSRVMVVETAPATNIVLENVLAVPPNTFHDGQYVICDNRFVFTVRVVPSLGPNVIGVGGPQREWTQWSFKREVKVDPFDIFAGGNAQVYLATMEVEIDFYSRSKTTNTVYEQEALSKQLVSAHQNKIFSPGQVFAMEQGGTNFKVIVRQTSVMNLQGGDETHSQHQRGILIPQTEVAFVKANNSVMQLKGASNRARTNLLMPNFKFENMGVGGLDEEFGTIFRRAFASRICPPSYIERLGIQHVKGVLLYGPPGTGKTLIARQIGKMLNTVEPKIVNGPEMLSKFVGGSEENIRKLFADAEAEYKAKGDESNLHIIIFDELDAVFKQRGSRSDGTGVGDNVVNQLLAKMDGVDQLNNILVIGMTNRKDLIDSALLRPGRFEVQMEIPLPDEKGRLQILTIHTAKMREAKILDKDVDLNELAAITKNYSGAEIEGLVKAAASFALKRDFTTTPQGGISFDSKKDISVGRDDFLLAFDGMVPAFGVAEEELHKVIKHGILRFSPLIDDLLTESQKLLAQVKSSNSFQLISVLMHGSAGAGKTALAAHVALESEFPFIKMISPETVVGMNEQQKVAHIQQVFLDAYKSPLSVVVVDQIEHIIEYTGVGPRFSNAVLQAIIVFVRRYAPHDHRLLVLATTSDHQVMENLGLAQQFNKQLYVPEVQQLQDLERVLELVNFADPAGCREVVSRIRANTSSDSVRMGIKQVMFAIESARATPDPASELVERVSIAVRDRSFDFSS